MVINAHNNAPLVYSGWHIHIIGAMNRTCTCTWADTKNDSKKEIKNTNTRNIYSLPKIFLFYLFVCFVFFRLTWTPLMSVIWTVSFSFRRSMSASPKHRYAEAKACTLLIVAHTLTHLNCAWTVPAFFGGVNLSCFNCRWPRRVPYYFVLLQISLPIMTALWSKTSFFFFSHRLVCWIVAFNLWQQAAIRLCSFCLKLTSTLFLCPHISPDYNVEFFRNYALVMNALDNRGIHAWP